MSRWIVLAPYTEDGINIFLRLQSDAWARARTCTNCLLRQATYLIFSMETENTLLVQDIGTHSGLDQY